MINKGQINAEELKIQGLVERYLKFRSSSNGFKVNENHLDEDSLNAFVEGRVNERESTAMVSHLIDCSYCLQVTGELAKLNAVFAEEEVISAIPNKEPMRVSEVLGGLFHRIFGTSDGAVFAHHEAEEKDDAKEDTNEVK